MMTGDEYRTSLIDGRRCYIDGERISDANTHPLLRSSVDAVAATYDKFHSAEPGAFHPMYLIPKSAEDLQARMDALHKSDITAATTAACMALVEVAPELATLKPEYRERIYGYVDYCKDADVRAAEVITDAKGHRRLRPPDQDDPDFYVRVVDRTPDGIVINGAKMHITGAPLVHEQVVLPTKRMRPGEEPWAVACAVPTNAEGVTIINTTNAPRHPDARNYPISGRHNMPEGFVIFDNVFVPNERVFLDGETSHAAMLAHALGLWERASAVAGSGSGADRLVGLAALLAEMNGIDGRPEIQDKLAVMAIYATMCQAGWDAAVANGTKNADGTLSPAGRFISASKFYHAELHAQMVDILHDIGGSLLVTAPSVGDLENPETGKYLEEFLRSGEYEAEAVLKVMHYLRDLTADTYGGWIAVTDQLAGGGQHAQRLVTLRHFDLERAKELAKRACGISGEASEPEGLTALPV